ncbi:MAG: hypothetical protein DRP95_06580 [Candidatus Latescibacterota bacterium]|nr:MAG: hypothetical protein DRP95_06580 [Candidatus Latescibacterota bacterium]
MPRGARGVIPRLLLLINVVLSGEDTGLKVDSLLLCGQIRTVAKERLLRKLSIINPARMRDVEDALRLYLGL